MNASSPTRAMSASTCKGRCYQNSSGSKKVSEKKFFYNLPESKKNLYAKDCCGHVSKATYHGFLIDLQKEIKKLDSTVALNFDEKSIFTKVLSAVRQSVEFINRMQNKYFNYDWKELENSKSAIAIQEAKLKNEAEKIKMTTKHLEQYELLLKCKNEKIKADEKIIQTRLEFIQTENLDCEELKLKCMKLEQELKVLKKNLISNKESEPKGIDHHALLIENHLLRGENSNLKRILGEKSIELIQNKNLMSEKQSLTTEKVILEQEKLELSQLRYSLEQEKSRQKIQALEVEKTHPCDTGDIESSMNASEVRSNISEKASTLDFRSKELDYRECILAQNEKELSDSLLLIKKEIESYNSELEFREEILSEMQSKLSVDENILNQKLIDMKVVEENLNVSRLEMEEISSVVLPGFEECSQALSSLLADLYLTKQGTENELNKVNSFLENAQEYRLCMEEERSMGREEFEQRISAVILKEKEIKVLETEVLKKEQALKQDLHDKITEISLELEKKLEIVQSREIELDKLKLELDDQKAENERVAMVLKVSYLELENDKIKQDEKIRLKKQKLRDLKFKLQAFNSPNQIKNQ
jgi:hypothetical protein